MTDAGGRARREERIGRILVAVTCVAFVLFCSAFVPRLTNVHFGDVEFTGWSGPLGSRLLHGDRPYIDFVLPIPPGSFVLLAALEKLTGHPLLLHELGLNAVLQLGMGLVAYGMARTITSPKNAVLTAVATLATVIQLNKECAYDHTAQLVAWTSILFGMRALASAEPERRARYWVLTGATAGLTLAFKQSTAIGAIFGWVVAFGYLTLVDVCSGRAASARARLPELRSYARGVALGLSGVWLLLVTLGSTLHAFFQAVFLDASILKGGAKFLLRNLAVYLFDFPSYAASLGGIAAFAFIGFRVVARHGSFRLGDERSRDSRYRAWEICTVVALVGLGFGGGFVLLARGVHPYPARFIDRLDHLKLLPPMSLVPMLCLFVAELVPATPGANVTWEGGTTTAGHSLNAAILASFGSSLMHNTSAPEFRPFYDNNTIIPVAFLALFIVLDRADLRVWSAALLALFIASAGGNKFFRAMTAGIPIGTNGEWAWMRMNDRGFTMAIAAARTRQLAGPEGTVLVLPEDVQFVGLVERPRPPIIGAIVFVDQYAPRLAADDIRRLDAHPPAVIVIHPRRPSGWQRFFRIWSGRSGAERLTRHVLDDMIPKLYRHDSTYKTTFLYEPGKLDIYARRDIPGTAEDTARTRREAEAAEKELQDRLPDDSPEAEGDDAAAPRRPNAQ